MNIELNQKALKADTSSGSFKIDYKRIIYRALRYWYLIVISLLITLSIAYIYNRYAVRVYPVAASVLMKEDKDVGAADLLYSNTLINPYRNYSNELYIIKSIPLIKSVLDDLNFGVTFFKEGNILTSELYDYPVGATVLNAKETKGAKFYFVPTSPVQFNISDLSDVASSGKAFHFNDTIEFNGLRCVFYVKDPRRLSGELNSPVIFQYTSTDYLAGSYSGKLNADWAEQGSGVLNLSINGIVPQKEKDFLSGFIKRYQNYDLQNKNEIASRTIDFINLQLGEIGDSMRIVEGNILRFKGRNVITDMAGESSRIYSQVEKVDEELTELIAKTNYYKYLLDYIEQDTNRVPVVLPSALGITDNVLANLVSEMMQLQLDLKLIEKTSKLNNPLVDQKRSRLTELKRNIREAIKTQKAGDKIKENFLNARIRDREQKLAGLPLLELEYVSIKRNYSLLENLYIYMLQKRAEASISKASNVSDIVVVNHPSSGAPISPQPTRNFLLATALGLIIPVAFFVLAELFNARIQSKEDIQSLSDIPLIGGVGHKTTSDNLAVLAAPKSAVAESFRALRSNLSYFLGDKQSPVILVTSSVSGEGKTFTSINLATVMAMSGKKTLIVGADLRKPKIFADFNLDNRIGLSSYLAGIATFDEALQATVQENLFMVSGGPVPPNPSELILNLRMEEFFKIARSRYDFIVVDSPPLAIVSDAFVLANHADHMLFLVRQNYTHKNMLAPMDEYYRSGRLKNVSILLNDIYRSGPGYGYGYGYTYGYGYGYGEKRKNGYGYYSDNK